MGIEHSEASKACLSGVSDSDSDEPLSLVPPTLGFECLEVFPELGLALSVGIGEALHMEEEDLSRNCP
eukprot:m.10649 g.10649  ORF g.10649 m.10649 type:complete len:68 (+) comp4344_c0_seq1:218-421(+)